MKKRMGFLSQPLTLNKKRKQASKEKQLEFDFDEKNKKEEAPTKQSEVFVTPGDEKQRGTEDLTFSEEEAEEIWRRWL